MKIVFIGCVEIGLKCLKQVIKDGWQVGGIFTLAKKYAGKTSGFVDFSPIAKKYGINLYKVKDINDKVNSARIRKIRPELIIVCGWQRLVGDDILSIPGNGTIAFHSSLLPQYRGRAPVNWAIINGEKKTGVTMFYCDSDADTGDIIGQRSFPVTLSDTCETVYEKAASAACELLHLYLPELKKGTVRRIRNDSKKYRFWPKRNPGDGLIDWSKKALDVHNWIRALTKPYPGAFTFYENNKYFIWKSKYSPGFNGDIQAEPGEILKVAQKNGNVCLLVATQDKPLWVLSIEREKGKPANIFTEGGKFS